MESFIEEEHTFQNCKSFTFGFQLQNQYDHHRKLTDMIHITYNSRLHKFIILDSRGILSWSFENAALTTSRELNFPKYQNRLLRTILYCDKYNVYFSICQDFTLEVFNKDFKRTCKAENPNMRSVLHLVFNPVTDELITAGMSGTVVWKYQHLKSSKFDEIKSMANYSLVQLAQYKNMGGSWCTKVDLIVTLQQFFYCSNNDLYVYNADGMKLLFKINNAHSSTLTCTGCWTAQKLIITGGMDTEVKVWGSNGAHIHTFRGHSRPITCLALHPDHNGIVMTSSLDGSIKVWSLHVMEMLLSLNVFSDGIDWMNITDDGSIWCATIREIMVYKFHSLATFWGHAQCKIRSLYMLDDPAKSRRVMAVGNDNCVRFFSPSNISSVAMCTVLPPPIISLNTDTVMKVAYSRHTNLIYLSIDPCVLWVYTAKTDPACRIAELNILDFLKPKVLREVEEKSESKLQIRHKSLPSKFIMHQAIFSLSDSIQVSSCSSIATAYSAAGFQFLGENGLCSAASRHMLLLGLEDGRIIFSDQKVEISKLFELAVSKDVICDIKFSSEDQRIITQSGFSHSVVQIWSLPQLKQVYKLDLPNQFSTYCLANEIFITGHTDGVLTVKDLASQPTNGLESELNKLPQSPDHNLTIFSIEACIPRKIFCSCSFDGMVKIWTFDKVLLSKLCLDDSLSSCLFLNSFGDLLIGWKRHIFHINYTLISSEVEIFEDDLESFEQESQVYEDPAIQSDAVYFRRDTEPINMQKYLAPYSFFVHGSSEYAEIDEEKPNDDLESTEKSDISIHAPTETYFSSASSIHSVDVEFFPSFGESPGPSPPSSTQSESELGFEELANGRENYLEETSKPDDKQQLRTTLCAAVAIAKMKGKATIMTETKNDDDEIPATQELSVENGVLQVKTTQTKNIVAKSSEKLESPHENAPDIPHKVKVPRKEIAKKVRKESVRNLVRKSIAPESGTVRIEVSNTLNKEVSVPEESSTSAKSKLVTLMGTRAPFGKSVSIPSKEPQKKFPFTAIRRPFKEPLQKSKASGKHKHSAPKSRPSRRKFIKERKSVPSVLCSDIVVKANESCTRYVEKQQEAKTYFKKDTISGLENPSISVNGSIQPVTQVCMSYKDAGLAKPTTSYEEVNTNTKPNIEDFVKGSTEAVKPEVNHTKPDDKKGEDENKSIKFVAEFAAKLLNKQKSHSATNMNNEDVYDYDENKMPDLFDFDFQAIYKNDGLQFDEKWQERMLDRYLLLKLQRDQRRVASANKRDKLIRERQYKIFSHNPELAYHDAYAWYEDHNRWADYILKSPLLTGNYDSEYDVKSRKALKSPFSVLPSSRVDTEPPCARPPSAIESSHRGLSRQESRPTGEDASGAPFSSQYRYAWPSKMFKVLLPSKN
ncbi:unnamed protein product [Clavelina lepadiformis]|uniref:Uncharacterized protein n=1 Tax=Clavelina lepadiformis TaxID=159417 RepID=A0ABP0GE43_CLALP